MPTDERRSFEPATRIRSTTDVRLRAGNFVRFYPEYRRHQGMQALLSDAVQMAANQNNL